MSAAHTEGPWMVEDHGTMHPRDAEGLLVRTVDHLFLRVVSTVVDIDVADLHCDADDEEAVETTRADAALVAAAPDHALLLATMATGALRWDSWAPDADGNRRGELAFDGLRYATRLDEFGCPILTDALRVALVKASSR